jgi:membrane fusion protein, peptide pheromone/bacteriocin exporter
MPAACTLIYGRVRSNMDSFKDFKYSYEFFDLKIPWVFTWFVFIVLSVIIAFFLWAGLCSFDIVVKTNAVLRPVEDVSSITNAVSGILQTKNFKNGQTVHAGDMLFVIDTSALETDRANTLIQQQRNQEKIQTLALLDRAVSDGKLTVKDRNSEAYIRGTVYFTEKRKLELDFSRAQKNYDREAELPKSMTSPQKLDELQNARDQAGNSLEQFVGEERLSLLTEKKTLLQEKETLETRLSELDQQLSNSKAVSPIAGVVEELVKLNPGDYLTAGQNVARVVPVNSGNLKAELALDARDIAKIKLGQKVNLRFSALAPSEYGQLEGIITRIGADTLYSSGETPYYQIDVSIPKNYMESKRSERIFLRAGMTAEAKIITKRERILRYILEKLDYIS